MPLDGNGNFSPQTPEYPALAGTVILASDFNALLLDIAQALSTALFRDGQAALTANLNFGGNTATNLAAITQLASIAGKATGLTVTEISQLTALAAGAVLSGDWSFAATPTAPTQVPGTNNTKLATCAFVVAQAFAAALPAQAGNAGKVVTTDGATASWSGLKTIGGNSLLGAGDIVTGIATAASITTSTTLTNASAGYQRIAMTTMGQSVTLPDATTLAIGAPKFYLDNSAGGYPVGIRNSAGTLLMAIAAGGTAYANCEDISTAAGVWAVTGTNLEPGLITIDNTFSSTYASTVLKPFVALDDNKSIHFLVGSGDGLAAVAVDKTTGAVGTPVVIDAGAGSRPAIAFKITATTAIVFYGIAGGNDKASVITLSGATTLAVGTAASQTGDGSSVWRGEDFSGAPKIAQLSTTLYLFSYATATGAGTTSVQAISVSGTTVTFGTAANIIAANNVINSTTTYALTATTGLVTYLENAASPYTQKVVVISVSGTTCTVGTPAAGTVNVNVNTSPKQSCLLSPTKVLIQDEAAAANPTNYYVTPYTISGTTVTAGTRFAVEIGLSAMGTSGYTDSSATRYNPHLFPLSASTALLWYFDGSGVSRAVVLSESGGTVTAGTKMYGSFSKAAINSAGGGAIVPQGTTEFVGIEQAYTSASQTAAWGLQIVPHKVSGTTITSGTKKASSDIYDQSPAYTAVTRMPSGAYVIHSGYRGPTGGLGPAAMPVFSSNGDFISYRGAIQCPGISNETNSTPAAVSSNRIVVMGLATQGTTVGASTYQLRLLSVEIAA